MIPNPHVAYRDYSDDPTRAHYWSAFHAARHSNALFWLLRQMDGGKLADYKADDLQTYFELIAELGIAITDDLCSHSDEVFTVWEKTDLAHQQAQTDLATLREAYDKVFSAAEIVQTTKSTTASPNEVQK